MPLTLDTDKRIRTKVDKLGRLNEIISAHQTSDTSDEE